MPIRNLDHIFRPQGVAVVGASSTPGKVGHTVLQNLLQAKFQGEIYPINPRGGQILGLSAARSVSALQPTPDLAIICTPASTVPELIKECGTAGIKGVIILTAGFRESGESGRHVEEEILRTARQFDGMRLIGPNCLGVLSPGMHLNASFAAAMPTEGRVAFISQSGALCTAILDWACGEGVGFSHFVSVGNMLDVGIHDLIDYFANDDTTDSILLYAESIEQPREFMSAARAFTRTKPIIAYKAGRFAASAEAAASHTGAMAGVDSVYEAAFARAGIVRVFDVEDMFDCAELLARNSLPRGSRLAIVSNAGGPGVMATDALLELQGTLASLSEETLTELNAVLPTAWSHRNPVDVLGDATPDRLAKGTEITLRDRGVDAVLVILTPQAMTDPSACAESVVAVARRSSKPVLTAWMGGPAVQGGIEILNRHGIPTYRTPENAVRAFMHLVQFARNRDVLYETPREIPLRFAIQPGTVQSVLDTRVVSDSDRTVLSEDASKQILDAYGIQTTKTLTAASEDEAVAKARDIGFPVVLKIWSEEISHKSDVGGVAINLTDEAAVAQAYRQIIQRAHAAKPQAHIAGVTVQAMVSIAGSRELILGAKRDPVFGPVMLIGAGGIAAELYQDHSLELPPLSERLAKRMLASLQIWPLLNGYRGRKALDIDGLIKAIMRLSYLVAEHPEICELDINPLLVSLDGCLALDARIVVDEQLIDSDLPRYSHLAIRPYPDEYIRHCTLPDGTQIILRPIKPEDEPAWQAMITKCSAETIHRRFRCLFKSVSHEFAARFCFIDYDREMAIVAESATQAGTLMGVGRLAADADHRQAEYAVLVADPWQGTGLGSLLTDYCLEISSQWGISELQAFVAQDNSRMLRIFEHRGFERKNFAAPTGEEIAFTRPAAFANAAQRTP